MTKWKFNILYVSLGFHQLNRWFIWSLKLLVKNKEEIWDKKTRYSKPLTSVLISVSSLTIVVEMDWPPRSPRIKRG